MYMKKILLLFLFVAGFAGAQSFVQNSISFPTCFGVCDGTVVLSTTTTAGPFTAVISNTSGCTNSTVQSSTGNTITIGGLCTCASDYSINIYNSSMVLVGFEVLQVPITATSALVLQTPTVSQTSCGPCCDATVEISFSGGYTPSSTHSVTLDGIGQATFNPISNVCAGQHTVCVKDQADCIVCSTFTIGSITDVKINSAADMNFTMYPNPASDKIMISFSSSGEVKLMDLDGKIVFSQKLETSSQKQHEIEIRSIPAGIYVMEFRGSAGSARQKLVKLN
jgi:hypothetical protein